MNPFRAACESVRFPLDGADGARTMDRRALPDLLARVRSDSLRIGPTSAPAIWRTVDRVCERLHLEVEPEVYVLADPTLNAFAPVVAGDARPVVILHSGLVQLLTASELAFAIGHELGHLGLGHAHMPASNSDNELDALKERSRQRYSELSADRVGLLATASTLVASTVMVKSASGLPDHLLGFDPSAFMAQVERADEEGSRVWELDKTHPALPFRLWALVRFAASDEYHEFTGGVPHGVALADVDAEVIEALNRMGDGHLSRLEETSIDRALMWAGALIVMADAVIEDHERDELRALVGSVRAEKALDFAERHGIPAVRTKFTEAVGRMRGVEPAGWQRMGVSLTAFCEALGVGEDATVMAEIRSAIERVSD